MNIEKKKRIFTMLGTVAESIPKMGHVRMAAAIVHRNEVITIGICERKTHPLQNRFKKCFDAIYMHAEINAIRKAIRILGSDELAKCDLFVARVKKFGDANHVLGWGNAKPCSGCFACIEAFNIQHVYYTIDSETSLMWNTLER